MLDIEYTEELNKVSVEQVLNKSPKLYLSKLLIVNKKAICHVLENYIICSYMLCSLLSWISKNVILHVIY